MFFSRTFKALNFDFQIQGLSRTFKVRANPEFTFSRDIIIKLERVFHHILNDESRGEYMMSKQRIFNKL